MDDVEKKLNNVLGVSDVPQTTVVTQVKPTTDPDTDTDFQYTRENLYNLIERGTDAMEGLLQVAQETEHPRAYEVVGQLMDKLTSANKELINMHKLVKEINRDDTNKSPSSVTNALFVGSTAELQKLLKKKAG